MQIHVPSLAFKYHPELSWAFQQCRISSEIVTVSDFKRIYEGV